jgi:hypothetical protein
MMLKRLLIGLQMKELHAFKSNGSVLGAMVDMIHAIAEFLNLFFATVLAGEELSAGR